MYKMQGKIGLRGFTLRKGKTLVFETKHRFGLLPSSTAIVHGAVIRVFPENVIGNKWSIIKNDHVVGKLDFTDYRYFSIVLFRKDGETDIFKLKHLGYSETYYLSKSDTQIMSFQLSLNPFRLTDEYKVFISNSSFSEKNIEELIYYCGETLYRIARTGDV